jgi:hypothetical protein
MFKKALAVATLAAASMVGVSAPAFASGSPGLLNEVFVPVCAPNWAVGGVTVPLGTTNVDCTSGQNSKGGSRHGS